VTHGSHEMPWCERASDPTGLLVGAETEDLATAIFASAAGDRRQLHNAHPCPVACDAGQVASIRWPCRGLRASGLACAAGS
jgi:hypothetical protein